MLALGDDHAEQGVARGGGGISPEIDDDFTGVIRPEVAIAIGQSQVGHPAGQFLPAFAVARAVHYLEDPHAVGGGDLLRGWRCFPGHRRVFGECETGGEQQGGNLSACKHRSN